MGSIKNSRILFSAPYGQFLYHYVTATAAITEVVCSAVPAAVYLASSLKPC